MDYDCIDVLKCMGLLKGVIVELRGMSMEVIVYELYAGCCDMNEKVCG